MLPWPKWCVTPPCLLFLECVQFLTILVFWGYVSDGEFACAVMCVKQRKLEVGGSSGGGQADLFVKETSGVWSNSVCACTRWFICAFQNYVPDLFTSVPFVFFPPLCSGNKTSVYLHPPCPPPESFSCSGVTHSSASVDGLPAGDLTWTGAWGAALPNGAFQDRENTSLLSPTYTL